MPAHESMKNLVVEIGRYLVRLNQTVTAVESCTGGGVAQQLTAVAGSSAWFERSFVTYSNQAKTEMVGVPEDLIQQYGAVSIEVAKAMAGGGKGRANSDYGLSVTGIAGPGGGTRDKPVGTVCFGWACPNGEVTTQQMIFAGDRDVVRSQSVLYALSGLLEILGADKSGLNTL